MESENKEGFLPSRTGYLLDDKVQDYLDRWTLMQKLTVGVLLLALIFAASSSLPDGEYPQSDKLHDISRLVRE